MKAELLRRRTSSVVLFQIYYLVSLRYNHYHIPVLVSGFHVDFRYLFPVFVCFRYLIPVSMFNSDTFSFRFSHIHRCSYGDIIFSIISEAAFPKPNKLAIFLILFRFIDWIIIYFILFIYSFSITTFHDKYNEFHNITIRALTTTFPLTDVCRLRETIFKLLLRDFWSIIYSFHMGLSRRP